MIATRLVTAVFLVALLAGCSGVPNRELPPTPDPIEKVNRGIFKFNRGFDRWTLRPIAKGYKKITPRLLRLGISNFFDNLGEPANIINNLLQGKFARAGSEVGRFLVNSVLGLGGLVDVASHAGWEEHSEDLGQTLAVWGAPSGPYVVVPFLGPYTLRDGFGAIDGFGNMMYWIDDSSVRSKVFGLYIIDLRMRFLDVDSTLEEALDPYVFLRESYLQHRTYEIYDGNPPLEEFPEDEWEDEAPPDEAEDQAGADR
jgi:phospholipid-binding lipoprotein MlaA